MLVVYVDYQGGVVFVQKVVGVGEFGGFEMLF